MVWIRSLFFTLLGPGTVLIWVPSWLLSASGHRFGLGPARWVGILPLVLGVAGLVWCIWEFTRRGRGTLAPVDEPRFVVRSGIYRWVRNPMYLSVLTALVGEIVVFRSTWVILWAAGLAIAFSVFVVSW